MRKKSHISLTGCIINNMHIDNLYAHRKAFYIGSILPDCVPSFITRRHCVEDTFEILRKEIRKLVEEFDTSKDINGYFCRHLGIVTHYIADYFTLPHNKMFLGNIKAHCDYEKELKIKLKQFVRTNGAKIERDFDVKLRGVDEICNIIKQKHDEYISKGKSNVTNDIEYIVNICNRIVDYILQAFDLNRTVEYVNIG